MQGFLLGLASGTSCLASCAPVLVPVVLGEGRRIRHNWVLLAEFLSGRLAGYLLFAMLAWATGQLILGNTAYRGIVFGLTYVALASLLLVYGIRKPAGACAGSFQSVRAGLGRWPALVPFGLGLLTGLSLCPPFLLAMAGAAETGTIAGSLTFFLFFFLGTSIYFLPVPLLGAFHRAEALRTVGRLAAALVALYYLYVGIILLAGGASPP